MNLQATSRETGEKETERHWAQNSIDIKGDSYFQDFLYVYSC